SIGSKPSCPTRPTRSSWTRCRSPSTAAADRAGYRSRRCPNGRCQTPTPRCKDSVTEPARVAGPARACTSSRRLRPVSDTIAPSSSLCDERVTRRDARSYLRYVRFDGPTAAHSRARRHLQRRIAREQQGNDVPRRDRLDGILATARQGCDSALLGGVGLLPDGKPLPPRGPTPTPRPLRGHAAAQQRLRSSNEHSLQADGTPSPQPLLLAAGGERSTPARALPIRRAEPGSRRPVPLARRLALEQLSRNCRARPGAPLPLYERNPQSLRRRPPERTE